MLRYEENCCVEVFEACCPLGDIHCFGESQNPLKNGAKPLQEKDLAGRRKKAQKESTTLGVVLRYEENCCVEGKEACVHWGTFTVSVKAEIP